MNIIKILFCILFVSILLNASNIQNQQSQANILFTKEKHTKENNKLDLRIDFNNAVLYLEQEKYQKAIIIFKKTAHKLKVPSFLNIGIAYYKLKSFNNSYLYLKKLYELKHLSAQDLYSYISASYYLYQITNDRKYLTSIINTVKKSKKVKIDEHVKLLLANTYIITKNYEKSINIIKGMKSFNNLKLALLYLKVKNYTKSEIYFQKALNQTQNIQDINTILWFEIYMGLKTNNIAKIKNNIDKIDKRLDLFRLYPRMPIKIYFNKNKYSNEEYYEKVTNFDENRKINMLFYFSPFIFSDYKQIKEESTFAYVLKNENSLESLESMREYNKFFSKVVKEDPITRVSLLQKHISNKDYIKAYEYYNLGLAYTHILSYKKAYLYFNKAYKLNKAHKLYNVLTLLSAKKADINIKKNIKTLMLNNLLSQDGFYSYISKNIYKIFFDKEYILDKEDLSVSSKNTTFYRFLKYIENKSKSKDSINSLLLLKDSKDPLVFLFRSLIKHKKESKYDYISRLQDYIPKNFNDYFLEGPYVITEYYIDILKALGIFNKVNFQIQGNNNPTYLRTKALINLYDGYAIQSIKIIENLQAKYILNDQKTYNLLIASYLSANDYSNASATLGMLQFELKDKNAKFLNAVQLLQNLKLNSAKLGFSNKYTGRLIDIELLGLDEYLENL